MRKFILLLAIILVSIVIAGLYGILHDQVTYSISPEYFTKFKYIQFGLKPQQFGGQRQTVAVVGFIATWWTGIFIGLGLGITALGFKDEEKMQRALQKAFGVIFCMAVACGVLGFLYGKFILAKSGVDWKLPDNLVDRSAFITVGSIHNFSYMGGFVGLVAGIGYLVREKRSVEGADK